MTDILSIVICLGILAGAEDGCLGDRYCEAALMAAQVRGYERLLRLGLSDREIIDLIARAPRHVLDESIVDACVDTIYGARQ